MKTFTKLLLLFALLFSGRSYALEPIIHPYQSIRGAGMGGLNVTTGLFEENFYGNPARAAANPHRRLQLFDIALETSSSTITNIDKLSKTKSDDLTPVAETVGNNLHARIQTTFPALYLPRPGKKLALAFGLLTSTQLDLIARNNYSIEPMTLIDIGPAATIVKRLGDPEDSATAVGVTAHFAYRAAVNRTFSLSDVIKGTSFKAKDVGADGAHFDFDLGMTHEFKHWTPGSFRFNTGLVINNMLDGRYENLSMHPLKAGKSPTQQPRSVGLGLGVVRDEIPLGVTSLRDFVAAVEIHDIGNNKDGSMWRTVHIGGEVKWKVLRPRAGLYQGYPSLGLGVDLHFLTIDAATYGEEMSLNAGGKEDRRYALRLALQI